MERKTKLVLGTIVTTVSFALLCISLFREETSFFVSAFILLSEIAIDLWTDSDYEKFAFFRGWGIVNKIICLLAGIAALVAAFSYRGRGTEAWYMPLGMVMLACGMMVILRNWIRIVVNEAEEQKTKAEYMKKEETKQV